ncbi:hypothetical protein HYPSUDRAFT_405070 [Hypholoma sublateritium FD-334 SS-4]|uniref:Sphingomyelin phosphodiesterase n=1 Tax=Hypholoma sublateritium (strain FD-334 SS-4) TaxID=945553 RepID=A0A0D2PAA8_HYPSF|nr:hypothetical protein HYPSUDRAFT_405070 [Hypholoma sublateritium FD-334 SS-4]
MLIWYRFALLLALTNFARASVVSNVLDALEQAVTCASCHALLGVLKPVTLLGDTIFSNALIAICQTLNAEDDDVCKGVIQQQGPIVAHSLRHISASGQTATKFCNALVGLCDAPAVNAYTVPFPKVVPSTPKVFTSTGKAPFRVVHFSDVHIDRSYTPGSEANCTKPICCRKFADQTGAVSVSAGPIGSHGCDTTGALSQSMLKTVSAQNTLFSIFTGDVVEASVWLVNQTGVTADLKQFNEEMAAYVNSPVYPVIGHEAAPINSFPRNTTSTSTTAQWVFDTQSQGWSQWIGTASASQVQHISGSYSSVVSGTDLRIISLNTVYWYKDNFWLYDSDKVQPDPNGILAFAVEQLQAAEDAGQRVWIIAHMPPSSADAFHDQSNYFNQIVQRYQNTIAAQFYGHSHVDEFAIAYSNYSNQIDTTANNVAYIAPSLTPRNANPAFRIYDVDPDTYEIMDSRTFISDMSDASFQTAPVWKLEYSARDLYGAAIGGWSATQSLTAAFWHKVTEAFSSNDALFQQFISLKTRGFDVTACTGECKTKVICNLRALRAENSCNVATPGFNFARRENIAGGSIHRGHRDHCEGTGLGSIFNTVTSKDFVDSETLRERLETTYAALQATEETA